MKNHPAPLPSKTLKKEMKMLQPKNKIHAQRLKSAANLSAQDLEILLAQKRESEIQNLEEQRISLETELSKVKARISELTRDPIQCKHRGDKLFLDVWESRVLETLVTLCKRSNDRQETPDIIRYLRRQYSDISEKSMYKKVSSILSLLASQKLVSKIKSGNYNTFFPTPSGFEQVKI